MKPAALSIELEDLCTEAGYRVRREKGSFSGSDCVLEGEKLILLNRNRPPEFHIGTLARVLRSNDLDQRFVKPAVRRELNRIWARLDTLDPDPLSVRIPDASPVEDASRTERSEPAQ